MYQPPAFREDRLDVLHQLIRSHPLGTLVTGGKSGLVANVIPFAMQSGPRGDLLRAHLAKANEQIADLREGLPALVIFQGPQGYVSPSWYETKREHGKVVPTWDYVIVQVRGTPMVIDDPEWLRQQTDELTSIHERGRTEPWSADDAPADYIAAKLKGIVGLEIPVEQIAGKWKVSQNQPPPNMSGVERGLRQDNLAALADEVAARAEGR